MANSKLKRIYQEDSTTGFTGNVLSQDNFNEIIEELLGLNAFSFDYSTDTVDYGNGLKVTLTKDTAGEISSIAIEARIFSQKTPYNPNTDSTIYSNADITNVDTTSNYVLYREDGTIVDKTFYTLGTDGKVTFGSSQTSNFFMMDQLVYIKKLTITITRDSNGGILKATMA